jgi:hypothetical protein
MPRLFDKRPRYLYNNGSAIVEAPRGGTPGVMRF